MNGKSIMRIVCVAILQAILLWELIFVQSESLRWYDWLIVGCFAVGVLFSILKELITDEYEKGDIEFDFDLDIEVGYVYTRIINAVLLCCVLWKTSLLSLLLPIPLALALSLVLFVGLYSIFNTIYYLISLLVAGSIGLMAVSSVIVGLWKFPAILVVILIGTGIMAGVYNIVMDRDKKIRDNNCKDIQIKSLNKRVDDLVTEIEWIKFRRNVGKVVKLIGGAIIGI